MDDTLISSPTEDIEVKGRSFILFDLGHQVREVQGVEGCSALLKSGYQYFLIVVFLLLSLHFIECKGEVKRLLFIFLDRTLQRSEFIIIEIINAFVAIDITKCVCKCTGFFIRLNFLAKFL